MNKADKLRIELAHTACRTVGHAWYSIDAQYLPDWGTPMHFCCERCDTKRFDTIDEHGQLSTRSYRYPEGYATSGDFRLSRAEYRLQLIRLSTPRRRRLKAV